MRIVKEAEIAEEEAKKQAEAQAQMQPNVSYFPMMINGQVQMIPVAAMNPVAPQEVLEEPKADKKAKKAKKEKKVKEPKVKVNCPGRKTQKAWWIVLVVVAVLAAVALYFVPNTKAIITEAYAALTDFDGSSWGRISKIGVYGVLVLAVLFLAFVWRTLVHPCGCKAKKDIPCTLGREFLLFLWTALIVGVSAIVACYFLDLYRVKDLINSILSFDFPFSPCPCRARGIIVIVGAPGWA